MRRQRILVVEDDPGMRDFYARFFARFANEDFVPIIVSEGEQALDVLQRRPVDIVLLDWLLPGISGQTLLRALRSHGTTKSIGVLMVTAKCSPLEEIQALDSGADDHLAKPFDEKVLLARLRSLSRRRQLTISQEQAKRYPGLDFDPDADSLRIKGRRVRLTPKEMGLLGIFLQRPNILHTHAYLWEALWDYESEKWEHLLVVTVSSLRRKLGQKWGDYLKCHKARGYVFEIPL